MDSEAKWIVRTAVGMLTIPFLIGLLKCNATPGSVALNDYLNSRERMINASDLETQRQKSDVQGRTDAVVAENLGRAEYVRAQQNRKIRVLEREAELEGAKLNAQAEIERAKGVAAANEIIGQSLKNNEQYLRWLWIHELGNANSTPQVIYVPTEAGMPILEAGKRP